MTQAPSPSAQPVRDLLAQAQNLIAQGLGDQAIALAQSFVDTAKKPSPTRRQAIYADVLHRAGRRAEAIACLREVEADLSAPQRLTLATLLHKEGDPTAAAALPDLTALCAALPHPTQSLLAYLRVLMAAGLPDDLSGDLSARATAALDLLPKDPGPDLPLPVWMELSRWAIDLQRPDWVIRAADQILAAPTLTAAQLTTLILRIQMCLTRSAKTGQLDPLAPRIERHLAQASWPRDACLAYAKCLSAAHQPDKAAALLDRPFSEPETEGFLLHHMQVKIALKDHAGAIALGHRALAGPALSGQGRQTMALLLAAQLTMTGQLPEAVAVLETAPVQPESPAIARMLFILKRQVMPATDLEAWRSELSAVERQKLPRSLIEGLSQISPRPRPLPMFVAGPIREFWDHQGLSGEAWQSWSAGFDWGQQATRLVRQWVVFADEAQKQELHHLIAPADTAPLDAALAEGRGAILASTHMGPVGAGLFLLEEQTYPLRSISAGGSPARTKSGAIELAAMSRSESVRQSVAHLKSGGVLGLMVDAISAGAFETVEFGNLRINVSTLPARLAWKFGVPSLWCQNEWVDGRIQVRFQALPRAEESETEAAFVARWLAHCTAILQPLLRGAPENLSGLGLASGYSAQNAVVSALVE